MKSRTVPMIAALLCCVSCTAAGDLRAVSAARSAGDLHWAMYYDSAEPGERFKDLDLVVFDRVRHPDFSRIHLRTAVLAYVNAGEVSVRTSEKAILEQEKALYPGTTPRSTQIVDLTNQRWHAMVLTNVTDAVNKGFDGVLLDTLDASLQAAAKQSPEAADASMRAAISLIREIRQRHPRIKIMLNRALDILPQTADDIDYVLAENILTEPRSQGESARLVSPATYQQLAGSLRWAQNLSSHIRILTLDYWNPTDTAMIQKIYAMQREQGFNPYVTQPDLRHFTPEPK